MMGLLAAEDDQAPLYLLTTAVHAVTVQSRMKNPAPHFSAFRPQSDASFGNVTYTDEPSNTKLELLHGA